MKSTTSRKFGAALVACLCLLGAESAEAVPPTILFDDSNNFGQAMALPGNSSSLATGDRGIAFTVGANSINLTSATFGMYGNAPGNSVVGLKLFQGSSSSGSLLQTLTPFTASLATIANGGTLVTFNTGGWTLNAGTQYFVAAYTLIFGSDVTARLGTTAIASGSWTQSGLTFNQFAQSSPVADNYYVQLNGTINAGAVPASGLAALGGLGFAVGRRRRR